MRAVEDAHLAFLVLYHIARKDGVELARGERQLLAEIFISDDPEGERLRLVDECVAVAQLLLIRCRLRTRIAHDNAVDERIGKAARRVEPCGEVCAEAPELHVFHDAAFQFLSVVLDELDGQHVEPLVGRTLEMLEACVEELRELRGECLGRAVREGTRGVVDDARLRRVGDDEAQGIEFGELHVGVVVSVGTQHAVDTFDDAVLLVRSALLLSAQTDGVEVLLRSKLRALARDGDDDGDACVEPVLLVRHVDGIVDEGAEEVALAELDDADGMRLGAVNFLDFFHSELSFTLTYSGSAKWMTTLSMVSACSEKSLNACGPSASSYVFVTIFVMTILPDFTRSISARKSFLSALREP